MPPNATSASGQATIPTPKTLKQRRRAIQDAVKQGRSGELLPETISSFLRDGLDAIKTTLETVKGDLIRPMYNGQKEYLPLNHLRAQEIANQCVNVIDTIIHDRRLRAGLLEKTDFTKGKIPALETSLVGGLVRYLAKPTENDEITRKNHQLLIDLLDCIAEKKDVASSFKLPNSIGETITTAIASNKGDSQVRARDAWERIQRRLTEITALYPPWRTQSSLIVEDRLCHGSKAQPSDTVRLLLQVSRPAKYPYYDGFGCLHTVEEVERRMAALTTPGGLVHAGPLAVAVAQFPQKAGLDRHNAQMVRRLIDAVRSERETPLAPALVESLLQYASVVRGEGFRTAGIKPHDFRKIITTALPYNQAQKLSTSLNDVNKYRKAMPQAMQARQMVELQREARHILHTDTQHGSERVIQLLELTGNPALQRKVLAGTLLREIIANVLAPVETDPHRAYDHFNRLAIMAGSNLSQAGLTRSQVSGFAAHATVEGWRQSLKTLADLARHYPLLDNALQAGRHKGRQQPASFARRARSKVLAGIPLFRTDFFGAIDPSRVVPVKQKDAKVGPKAAKPKAANDEAPSFDAWAELKASASKAENPAELAELLRAVRPSERSLGAVAVALSMGQAQRNKVFSLQIVTDTVYGLFQDAKKNPDRAYEALRHYIPLIQDQMSERPVSREKLEGFLDHASNAGWTEVEPMTATWGLSLPEVGRRERQAIGSRPVSALVKIETPPVQKPARKRVRDAWKPTIPTYSEDLVASKIARRALMMENIANRSIAHKNKGPD